jgi:hypothetical protein
MERHPGKPKRGAPQAFSAVLFSCRDWVDAPQNRRDHAVAARAAEFEYIALAEIDLFREPFPQ